MPLRPDFFDADRLRALAALARLEVSTEEATALGGQLAAVVGLFDQIASAGAPTALPATIEAEPLRPDEPRATGFEVGDLRHGYFVVPQVISREESGG